MNAVSTRKGHIAISDTEARLIQFAARAIGLLSVALFFGLAVVEGPPRSFQKEIWEEQVQFVILAIVAVGYVISWRWEWVGGGILVFGAIALGIFAAIALEPREAALPMLAFFVPGALFLLHWQRNAGLVHIAGLVLFLAALLTAGGIAAAQVYDYYFGPTHPQSDRDLPPVDLVEWAWTGAVTGEGFTVKALLDDDMEPTLLVSTSEDLAEPIRVPASSVVSDDYPLATFVVTGLTPDTEYYFAVADGDDVDSGRRGAIHTFPTEAASFTFALGSCARVGSNGEVFETILDHDPLLFIATGDFHYENITTNDIGRFRNTFAEQIHQPAQQALYLDTAFAYVWDDHDFGGDGSDSHSEARPAALAAYRENVPHYPLALAGGEAPIAQTFAIGRAFFIVTDGRSMRDPLAPEPTMLGSEQLTWLKQELVTASEQYPLVFWVNAVPWIAAAEAGADHWGGFAAERAEIAEHMAANGVDNVVMLSGDAHMLAIDDGSNSAYAEGQERGPVVFHAAPLDRPGSVRGGPYSEGAFPGSGQFGLVTVTDTGGDTIEVTLSGRNYLDDELVGYTFTVPVDPALAADN